jgi:hypothetical protein
VDAEAIVGLNPDIDSTFEDCKGKKNTGWGAELI